MLNRLDAHKDQAGAWDVLSAATGELAFDIGANIGQSTKVLANGFKKVVAFEPCLESFDVLQVEMPFNVIPVQLAVSDQDGMVELEEHAYSIGTGQLTSGDGLYWGPKVGTRQVPSRTLYKLAQDFGYPDFVKIDTEGHEVQVCRGGADVLIDCPSIIIEVHKVENEVLIREILAGRDWVKLEHNFRPGSLTQVNHFWLVSNHGT